MRNLIIIFFFFTFTENVFSQDSLVYMRIRKQLDSVYVIDQKYRGLIDDTMKKYGNNSKETISMWKVIELNDSMNLEIVTQIIDKYGWLGSNIIGIAANKTLFLVIQHSNLKTMEKYLPIMKVATNNGNASKRSLAMLEDRVEMINKRPQIYGTQVQFIDGKYVLYKTLDEKNLNKRRAEVGLDTIEDYLKNWDIEYKQKD